MIVSKIKSTLKGEAMTTSDPELDKILGKHSVHFNYSKAETREKLLKWHLQKCRSYLPEEIPTEGSQGKWVNGFNDCIGLITKRIEGDK